MTIIGMVHGEDLVITVATIVETIGEAMEETTVAIETAEVVEEIRD